MGGNGEPNLLRLRSQTVIKGDKGGPRLGAIRGSLRWKRRNRVKGRGWDSKDVESLFTEDVLGTGVPEGEPLGFDTI